MSLTENSDQVFLPEGCNRTQNLRLGPYTTEESPASWMVKLFGEVGGGVPEYFSLGEVFR